MSLTTPPTAPSISTAQSPFYSIGRFPNTTPFTYRDGSTFAEMFEQWIDWVEDDVLVDIVADVNKTIDAYNGALLALDDAIKTYLADSAAWYENSAKVLADVRAAGAKGVDDITSTLSTARTEIQGYVGAASTSAGNAAGSATNAASSATAAANAAQSIRTVLVNAGDYGVVGDGSDETARVNAALAAVPNGGRVILPPNKVVSVAGTLVNTPGKSFDFDLNGSTILKTTASSRVMTFSGVWDNTVSITGITAGTLTEAAASQATVVVTHAGTMPWKRGDVVKLFSDDTTPGVRDSNNRTGQFMTVYSADNGSTTFLGTVRDPLTTSPRMARLNPATVSVRNGVLDVLDSALANMTGEMIGFDSMTGSSVTGVIIKRSPGQGITFASCYGGLVENNDIRWCWNDGATRFGYGVNNNVSEGISVIGNRMAQIRHGYTDSSSGIAATGSTDPRLFGRAANDYIAGNTVTGATSFAYDTHAGGIGHVFVGNRAYSCLGLHALRGRNHTIKGGRGDNVGYLIRIFNESAGGDSYGHNVEGVRGFEIATSVIEAANNWSASDPRQGTRETNPNVIRNVFAENVRGQGIVLTNCTMRLSDIDIEYRRAIATDDALNKWQNAGVYGHDIRFGLFNTTGADGMLIDLTTSIGSDVDLHHVRLRGYSQLTTRLNRIFRTSDQGFVWVENLLTDYPIASVYGGFAANSFVDWSSLNRPGGAAGYTTLDSAGVATTANLINACRTRLPNITIEATTATNATLAQLPVPFVVGQRLTVFVATGSAGTLTVNHDIAGRRTDMTGAAAKTIAAGAALNFVATAAGTWKQV